jgi:hypothetical protein
MYVHGFGLFTLAEDFAAIIVFSRDIFKAYLYQTAGSLDVHGNFNDELVLARMLVPRFVCGVVVLLVLLLEHIWIQIEGLETVARTQLSQNVTTTIRKQHGQDVSQVENSGTHTRAFQLDSFSALYMHSEALHNPTKNCEGKIVRAKSARSVTFLHALLFNSLQFLPLSQTV